MTHAKRAAWLVERHTRWAGLGPAEAVDGALSPRVVDLVVEMRDARLFPDLWDEREVLFSFLAAVCEARTLRRQAYARVARASEGADTWSPAPRRGAALIRAYL